MATVAAATAAAVGRGSWPKDVKRDFVEQVNMLLMFGTHTKYGIYKYTQGRAVKKKTKTGLPYGVKNSGKS